MQRKTIIGLFIFLTSIFSSISYAGTHSVELNASRSSIEGGYDYIMPVEYGFLGTGVGVLYSDDDYRIGNARFTLGNGISSAGLRFSLGFKGILGNVEENSKEADVMAFAFLFTGIFTIPETIVPIPVDFSLNISIAPEPLCFLDSDRYIEYRASLDFKIVKNAAVMLGYRRIETHLEQDQLTWEKSDGSLFIGYRLRF
jgi:hypothetical protein